MASDWIFTFSWFWVFFFNCCFSFLPALIFAIAPLIKFCFFPRSNAETCKVQRLTNLVLRVTCRPLGHSKIQIGEFEQGIKRNKEFESHSMINVNKTAFIFFQFLSAFLASSPLPLCSHFIIHPHPLLQEVRSFSALF